MANEKRLIDANKAQAVLMNMAEHLQEAGNPEMAGAVGYAAEVIGKQPTVDAVEVVHGRWAEKIKDERFGEEWDEIALYECSVCKSEFVEGMGAWRYCPNCGAKMDGDGNG